MSYARFEPVIAVSRSVMFAAMYDNKTFKVSFSSPLLAAVILFTGSLGLARSQATTGDGADRAMVPFYLLS